MALVPGHRAGLGLGIHLLALGVSQLWVLFLPFLFIVLLLFFHLLGLVSPSVEPVFFLALL